MLNKLDSWRSPVLFWLIVAMMTALFFSRAVLSVGLVAFVTISFFHPRINKQFAQFFASPLLWGMSLLFFIPLVSGCWSADTKQWSDIVRIKLPLLFLPLAFAGYGLGYRFSERQWEWLLLVFIGLITAGAGWSLYHYLSDPVLVNESYLKAKTIVTPLENDHVRFSWLVSVGILLCGWLVVAKRKENRMVLIILCIVAVSLIIFLHILAVRTGLFSFYIMLAGTAVWLLIKKIKRQYAVGLLLIAVSLPWIAYHTFPTFQNRVKYFLYDRSFFVKGEYWPHSTDAVRMISLKAGWAVMNNNPLKGVGAGDVLPASRKWYAEQYPQMIESDKILPSSEWMIYGATAGWPGFILFTVCMLIPFFIRSKNKLVWWLLNATAGFSFLFDIGLEVQFGVFIYVLVILLGYHWWERSTTNTKAHEEHKNSYPS